jgi:hypothetical protein
MPDLLTEAPGRIRVRGADEGMLERAWGGYRRVFDVVDEEPGQALAWLLEYEGPDAAPALAGRRVRVEHELTAIRVPVEDGYELHLPERGAIVRRTPGRVAVRGERRIATELLRKALRQVVTRAEQRQGMVQLHASAVADERGRVLAFMGPREAGKTTTLTASLLRCRLRMVTNDRLCLVAQGEPGPLVYGWPTDYTVGHGTLQAAGLWERVPPERRDLTQKMHFSPEEFAALCGATYAPRGHLAAIAFMRLDLSGDACELAGRAADDAIPEIMTSHVFTVDEDEDHPDWLELGGDLRPGQELDVAAARLRCVRFHRLTVGRDLDRNAERVRELLGAIATGD